MKFGIFCEIYGKTLRNLVIEYLLEMRNLDFAVGDMAEEIEISRPKAYEIIKNLEKENIVKKSRTVSGTQLYILNKNNIKVKLLTKTFKECLNLVIENQQEKLCGH